MLETRDVVVCAIYAVYMGMVMVGTYYYSWTPLCFLYPLLIPKSKACMFVNKKYVEASRHVREAIDAHVVEGVKLKKKIQVLYWASKLNVPMVIYLGLCHLVALYGAVLVLSDGTYLLFEGSVTSNAETAPTRLKAQTIASVFVLWVLSGWGITAGAHRLWAHRAYTAHWSIRALLMVLNSIANQGSILRWSRDHRTHHRHSDTDADPHNSNRGFFFSHCGWLLVQKSQTSVNAGRNIDISDLKADPIVMLQHRLDPWWSMAWCFVLPTVVAMYQWDESWYKAFVVAGMLRYVIVLHVTWSVNSIVHSFGPPTYDPTELPAESRFVSLIALGEGWHSWHHAFAFDYATSELGCLHQFNPTKAFIDFFAAIGLVTGRKRGTRMWHERKERWKKQHDCDIVETLHGPPMFKIRHLEFVPKKDGPDAVVREVDIVPAAERRANQLTKENIVNTIPAPRERNVGKSVAIVQYFAHLHSMCSVPWEILLFVMFLDMAVPVRWVTPGRRVEKDAKSC